MYFLKTKGTSTIPDFVQIRDDTFALTLHFKLSDVEKKIKEIKLSIPYEEAIKKIKNAEFEKVIKLD
jgi:hypothetical protein